MQKTKASFQIYMAADKVRPEKRQLTLYSYTFEGRQDQARLMAGFARSCGWLAAPLSVRFFA